MERTHEKETKLDNYLKMVKWECKDITQDQLLGAGQWGGRKGGN